MTRAPCRSDRRGGEPPFAPNEHRRTVPAATPYMERSFPAPTRAASPVKPLETSLKCLVNTSLKRRAGRIASVSTDDSAASARTWPSAFAMRTPRGGSATFGWSGIGTTGRSCRSGVRRRRRALACGFAGAIPSGSCGRCLSHVLSCSFVGTGESFFRVGPGGRAVPRVRLRIAECRTTLDVDEVQPQRRFT